MDFLELILGDDTPSKPAEKPAAPSTDGDLDLLIEEFKSGSDPASSREALKAMIALMARK